MRIFYPLPALPRNGGIKVCIQHSHILNQAGYQCVVVTPSVCENPYPRYISARFMLESDCLECIQPDDIFVFCWAESIRPFFHLENRFIFFSQGVINSSDPVSHTVWLNSRFELMTLGTYSRDFFRYAYNRESRVITNWVDTSLFRPAPEVRVPGRIGMIQHRNYQRSELLEALKSEGFETCILSGTEEQVADGMQRCDFFLSTAEGVFNGFDCAEGFAFPCAEAMASGALLISYNNRGCLAYALDRVNCRISWECNPDELLALLRETQVSREKERMREFGAYTIEQGFNASVIRTQLIFALGL